MAALETARKVRFYWRIGVHTLSSMWVRQAGLTASLKLTHTVPSTIVCLIKEGPLLFPPALRPYRPNQEIPGDSK